MRFSLLASIILSCVVLLAFSPDAQCKDKKRKAPPKDPQDAIEVVGHIPPTGAAVTRFLSTQHYSRYYLYVEHEGGSELTLVDVSKVDQPAILANVPSPTNGMAASLFAVAGTAALITEQASNSIVTAPQTLRIMDFSDPKQPRVAREFAGVTAVGRDDQRGLIFLANDEGIWILRRSFAEDPESEREYARRILYDH